MLHAEHIPYVLRRKRFSRVLRFAVHADGRLVVTAPVLIGKRTIEKMIAEKREWILEKLEIARKNAKPVAPKRTKKEIADDKDRALALIRDRIEHFNLVYRLSWKRIAIRNQKTRWGSCSRKGNLNFNYKIALLPPHLADYIIVHELCHLAQMNHSKKFWELVAQTIPDWRGRRNEIREHEIRLR
ncbi:MAG: M48 family metallopeptidase [Patescibacteria group bacterium]